MAHTGDASNGCPEVGAEQMGAADSFHYIVSVPPRNLYGNLLETPTKQQNPALPNVIWFFVLFYLIFLFCFVLFFYKSVLT